jgi:large subunit ribosomal protein L24
MSDQPKFKIRLKKGDIVMVRAGKLKGKTGKVTMVHPKDNKVTVEGLNIMKKHVKPNRQFPQGAITDLTVPMWVSKVGLIDPVSKKPTRIGYKLSDKQKVRVYKSSGKEVK